MVKSKSQINPQLIDAGHVKLLESTGKQICHIGTRGTLADCSKRQIHFRRMNRWSCDFQKCDMLTGIDSDELVQSPLKL